MRTVVTGGAGFIGSHIVDALIERGHDVAVIDDLSTGFRENVHPDARLHVMDVGSPELADVMDQERPEALFHEAAQMDVRKSVADPIFDATINVMGAINVYENCLRTGVKKIVFASTGGAIYGEQDVFPADEEHAQRPLSPYGVSKLANEKYLYYYREIHGLPYVALRYANVYGPRQNPHGEAGVVAIFARMLLAGDTPTINGTGEQTRDYVYVGDVAAANVAALEFDGSDAFNVSTGIETDVNALFDKLRHAVGGSTEAKRGPAKVGEQLRSVVDWGRIGRVLGWSPRVSLDDGLRKTVDWFREHRED